MAELINLPYTLSDGTEAFCQASSDLSPEEREAFREYVRQRHEEALAAKRVNPAG